jgi:DNA phosphorothioation-dependent restriction protein DptG
MTTEEKMLFTSLLFNHKHLWLTFQEYRYIQEHPEMDWETVHERFSEEVEGVYQTLADAVREGEPLQDTLRTILRMSDESWAAAQNEMKER